LSFERGEYTANVKTPGCTDYSPEKDIRLKKEPCYAPQTAKRWGNKNEEP
jgi:hypothetical protein